MTRKTPAILRAPLGPPPGGSVLAAWALPKHRKPKPRPAASYTALPCVVLAIDPGETSGWAVLIRGEVWCSASGDPQVGAVSRAADRASVVCMAQLVALRVGLPLVVVAETWPRRMGAMQVGAFASWQGWKEALAEAKIPKRRIVRVQMGKWSAKVLGNAWLTTATRRTRSIAIANARLGLALGLAEHDAGAAACLGVYACRSPEVAKAMPKPRQRTDKSATAAVRSEAR